MHETCWDFEVGSIVPTYYDRVKKRGFNIRFTPRVSNLVEM
jgi:hypothetical protein